MSLDDRLALTVRGLHKQIDWFKFALHYAKSQTADYGLPLPTRLRLLRYGFLPSSWRLYRLRPERRGDYLTDYARYCRTPFINGDYRFCLDNKIVFSGLLQRYPEHLPCTFGMIDQGRLLLTRDARGGSAESSLEELVASRTGKVVLKPVAGATGCGVMFLERAPTESGFLLNAKPRTAAELRGEIKRLDGYIVDEFVRQHPSVGRLHPTTPNTVRLWTMRDPDSGEPFIAGAVLRIGSSRSSPIDSFTQGGLCAAIDLASGRLGQAISRAEDGSPIEHNAHPETGTPIAGEEIPGWRRLADKVLEICEALHFLNYIGWDIVVTEDGFRVIEGNSHPNMRMLQIQRPLLADPRIRRFYEVHGVVRANGRPRVVWSCMTAR
jgi:hypothetical protein